MAQRARPRGGRRRHLLLRPPARDLPHTPGAGVLPLARGRDGLRGPVPRPAAAARAARGGLRHPGPADPVDDHVARGARRARDRPDVLRVRGSEEQAVDMFLADLEELNN